MDPETFWGLIEQSRVEAGAKGEQHVILTAKLTALDIDEVIEFERCMFAAMAESYRNDLWTACYLLDGGYASDDGFKDFRSYLISKGRDFFQAALLNPDDLAEMVPPGEHPQYEVLQYAAGMAYTEKTGSWFYEDGIEITPPDFVLWELTAPSDCEVTVANAPEKLPKLWRRFVADMNDKIAKAKIEFEEDDIFARRRAIWQFYQYASHSEEALQLLEAAAKHPDKQVRQAGKEKLGYYRRDVASPS